MKQNVSVLLCVLLVFSANLQAQITLIPKVGFTAGTYAIRHNPGTARWGMGGTAGLCLNIPYGQSPWLSFQPELTYVQKKFSTQHAETLPGPMSSTVVSKNRRRNDYLEVPILAKARFGKNSIRGFINAGPSVGFYLGSKSSTELVIDGQRIEITPNGSVVGKATNWLEIGLQLGGGLELSAGPGALLLEARYGAGLTNFIKKHKIGFPGGGFDGQPAGTVYFGVPADQKSRTFLLSCGYAIPLK